VREGGWEGGREGERERERERKREEVPAGDSGEGGASEAEQPRPQHACTSAASFSY
jgi:hypothetical protein